MFTFSIQSYPKQNCIKRIILLRKNKIKIVLIPFHINVCDLSFFFFLHKQRKTNNCMRENNNFIKLVLLSLVYLLILLFLIHIIRDIYKWKKSYYIEIKVQMTIILNFFFFLCNNYYETDTNINYCKCINIFTHIYIFFRA